LTGNPLQVIAMNNSSQFDAVHRDPRGHLIQQLRRQLGRWETTAPAESTVFSSGAAAIDRLLPGGGLRHGMLVEWLGEESRRAVVQKSSRAEEWKSGSYSSTPLLLYRSTALPLCRSSSAATLSLLAAREACRSGGILVVLDRQQTFYPPAAAAWGIDLGRLIVVRPRSARDELWAAVQALRSPAVAAVWGAIDRLDSRAFRRLQLAAQAGRTLGLLLRPANVRGQPSWADVRLEVGKLQNAKCKMQIANWRTSAIENLQFAICNLQSFSFATRHVRVRVLRLRGGRAGSWTTLEIDDAAHTVREVNSQHDTHPLPVVTELADPAGRSLSARA
jgi:hypothetical protein